MLGELVRSERGRRGWSQAQLAERAGFATSTIATIERGHQRRPRPRTLRDVARALGLALGLLEAASRWDARPEQRARTACRAE